MTTGGLYQDSTGESMVEAVGASVAASLKHANFCLPGVVDSFDATTARCAVVPALDQLVMQPDTGDITAEQRPLIHDVPVVYPAGGGISITFPLAQGDAVLLVFSQRGLTEFKRRLSAAESTARSRPDARVFFALRDAIAIPGFASGASHVPASGINLQTSSLTINGAPAFDTQGPLIASAPLVSGSVPEGGNAISNPPGFSVATGVTGWTASGAFLVPANNAPHPPQATGFVVRLLDAMGEVHRTHLPLYMAGGDINYAPAEYHLLYHSRTGANRFRSLIVQRGFPLGAEFTLTLRAASGGNWVDQTLAAGLTCEVRYRWNGGPVPA